MTRLRISTDETKNDGGAAFPREDYQCDVARGQRGMTLRDYFAARAIQGFCANPSNAVVDGFDSFAEVAKEAYEIADAMLKARGE